MKKNSILSSLFGYLALTSGSIWFGAYIARLLTTYQMFEETDFLLKSYVTETNITGIFNTIFPIVNLTFYSYMVMVTSFTLFLILSNFKLKQNGWLLIVSLIMYLTLPLESILLMIDYKLIGLFLDEKFASEQILKLVIERMSKLSSFPIILISSYLTIPFFLIFRPFTLKVKNED